MAHRLEDDLAKPICDRVEKQSRRLIVMLIQFFSRDSRYVNEHSAKFVQKRLRQKHVADQSQFYLLLPGKCREILPARDSSAIELDANRQLATDKLFLRQAAWHDGMCAGSSLLVPGRHQAQDEPSVATSDQAIQTMHQPPEHVNVLARMLCVR